MRSVVVEPCQTEHVLTPTGTKRPAIQVNELMDQSNFSWKYTMKNQKKHVLILWQQESSCYMWPLLLQSILLMPLNPIFKCTVAHLWLIFAFYYYYDISCCIIHSEETQLHPVNCCFLSLAHWCGNLQTRNFRLVAYVQVGSFTVTFSLPYNFFILVRQKRMLFDCYYTG